MWSWSFAERFPPPPLIFNFPCNISNTTLIPSLGCDGRYDITFIIDASGSIRAERFPYILNFINNVIDEFEVSSDKAR